MVAFAIGGSLTVSFTLSFSDTLVRVADASESPDFVSSVWAFALGDSFRIFTDLGSGSEPSFRRFFVAVQVATSSDASGFTSAFVINSSPREFSLLTRDRRKTSSCSAVSWRSAAALSLSFCLIPSRKSTSPSSSGRN